MLIKRRILPPICSHLSAKEITLITGARQVGKTTLMNEIKNILDKKGQKTLYFNLDFESDFGYLKSQELFLQKINLEIGNNKGYIFIDEIQRKENAGLFLKGLFDRGLTHKFIVSGSGSMELKEKIHESLTGRKRVFELSTVTFIEFVNYKTGYRYEDNLSAFFEIEQEKTLLLLNEFLTYGGYPRIVTETKKEEKFLLINEIYNSYLKKDIAYLLKIDKPELFSRLIQLLAYYTGSIMNYSTLSTDIGISVPTLKKYLWYAENTFIIKSITPYFKNKRKEIRKSQTVYFNDVGLKNFALNHYGKDIDLVDSGYLFQNFIFLLLQDLFKEKNYKIHFWRTTDGAEVDFLLHSGNSIIPIEVKFSRLKNAKIQRSFRNFIKSYEPKKGYVINLDYSNELKINKTIVKFLPFYKLYDEQV